MATSIYILNQSPTKEVLKYEALKEENPSTSYLKVFCYIAYAMIDAQKHSKLEEKSIKCIFVGYSCPQTKAYRLFDPRKGGIITSKNVVFDEEARWDWKEAYDGIQFSITFEEDETLQSQEQPTVPPTPEVTIGDSYSSSASPHDEIEDQASSRRVRTIRDLYEATHAPFVADLMSFNEANKRRNGDVQ